MSKSELNYEEIDQTVICDERHLPQLLRLTNQTLVEEVDYRVLEEKAADPAIFYPFTEDSGLKRRLNEISRQTHVVQSTVRVDPFPEKDVEKQYLEFTPMSFFILGKPELGQTEVARLLSARWKCVDLNPTTLVEDEIRLKTRIGKCFEFNLKCGRSIRPDIVLRLLHKRVETETAQHRGFVISGFPIYESDLMHLPLITESAMLEVELTLEDILPSEETLDKIVQKKMAEAAKKKPKDVTFKEEVIAEEVEGEYEGEELLEKAPEKSEESIVVSDVEEEAFEDASESVDVLYQRSAQKWTLADDVDVGETDQVLLNKTEQYLWGVEAQMQFLFNLFPENFVIVYMSCDHLDALNMRMKPRTCRAKLMESKRTVEFSISSSMMMEPIKSTAPLPRIDRSYIASQLREYRYQALPVIDQHVLQHNPDYFMKIDARLSPTRIVETILERLKVLAVPPVVLPVQLKLQEEEDDADNSKSDCKDYCPEQYFQSLRYQNVISPIYRLELSFWNYKCPVATKHGTILKGRGNKAIKFMNKIFFLSNDEALLSFYRNPRPYLCSVEQVPLKIWISGPDWSGKSALATSLSTMFNAIYIDPEHLKQNYVKRMQLAHRDDICTKALEDGIEALRAKREQEKQMLINEWKEKATELLVKASTYTLTASEKLLELGNKAEEEINEELIKMNLPNISEAETLNELLKEPSRLSAYLPVTLTEPIKEVDAFHPFVVAYVDDILRETPLLEVPMTPQLQADIINTAMKKSENDHYKVFSKKPSLVVDGMPVDLEILEAIEEDLFADYIICLKDNDPKHAFLINRLFNQSNCDNRQLHRFLSNIRNFSNTGPGALTNVSRLDFIKQLVNQMQDSSSESLHFKSDANLKSEITKVYAKNIDEFNSKWDITATYLSQKCKDPPIVIDVTDKTSVQVIDEVRSCLENKYQEMPVVVTAEDKMQEMQDFVKSMKELEPVSNMEVEGEEEVEGEADESPDWENLFLASRKFGNTSIYCPVAFFLHSVLWKGREEYSVRFKRKLYYLSGPAALQTFLQNPYKVLKPGFPSVFPPARIVIVGTLGSGKTTLAKRLAKHYGLCYLHFDSLFLKYLNIQNVNDIFEVLIMKDIDVPPKLLDVIKDYLLSDGQSATNHITHILRRVWQTEPYSNYGFVLDGYPRRKSDIQLMITNYFIPDMMIELQVTQNEAHSRVFPTLLDAWKADLHQKQLAKQAENEEILDKWRYDRELHRKFLMMQKEEQRRVAAHATGLYKKRLLPTPVSSKVSVISLDEESEMYDEFFSYTEDQEYEDMLEVEQILDEEMPEPLFDDKWESESEATERIRSRIDANFTREIEHLSSISAEVVKENIEHVLIDTDGQKPEEIIKKVLQLSEKYKYRNPSLFEDVFEISTSLAEQLLAEGYYFLSKFGRMCPVQIYERLNPIPMYLHGEETLSVHVLLHRRYIYFLQGEANRDKFKTNPVKYVLNPDFAFPLFPIRIAIIGPPKCGKSTLARRFQRDFGLKVITRGNAIRYVLSNFPESEVAKNMHHVLNRGWCLTDEMVVKAVEALTLDGRSVSLGYVLDGFPNTASEMQYLTSRNITPFVVLDLQADLAKIKDCTEACKMDLPFTYSFEYITTMYSYWRKNSERFRDWLSKQYQNIYSVDTSKSKWYLWREARAIVFSALKNMHKYLKESKYEKAHIVNSFCITSDEFSIRQSSYKNYCPCCLNDGRLHYRESTSDWKNIVLYRGYYYAICSQHLQNFTDEPDEFLPPLSQSEFLPKHLPMVVSEINTEKIQQDGYCLVTFWDSMPQHVLVKGDTNLAVRYRKRYYLFCRDECLRKFMVTPETYFSKKIHFRKTDALKLCDINKLPVLGYLEQCVSQLLIKAIVNTEITRPFCLGLTIEASAAINLGFFLKRFNPRTPKEVMQFVEEGYEKFEKRRKIFRKALFMFKSRRNPFLHSLKPRKIKLKGARNDSLSS